MEIARLTEFLQNRVASPVDLYERRPGNYQLVFPIFHEDGDMVDIYLQTSPVGEDHVRICDFGMALMRLSYTYDINSGTRRRIFDSILINSGVQNDEGNLFLDSPVHSVYEGVLQFAGCVQKICNMRYWQRETVRSAFYEDLETWVNTDLSWFNPQANQTPIPDYPLLSVDWTLEHNNRNFYVFGVRGNNKAKNVAISLLEFQKAKLPFLSLVVHENFEELGGREQLYLTKNADTQYPVLNDFQEKAVDDIIRFAGAPV